MSLSSSSTLTEVIAAYRDNALYDVDSDTTAARTFIHACRMLKVMVMKSQSAGGQGGHAQEFDTEQLAKEEAKAEAWLDANTAEDSGSRYVHADFRDYRS